MPILMEITDIEQNEQIARNLQLAIFTADDNGFQATKWFVTYHIRLGESFKQAFQRLEPLYELCSKYVFSEEHGKSGKTPHIQGAFILKGKVKYRASTLQNNFFKNGVTLRKLNNWEAAFKYCRKEGNKIVTSEKIPPEPEVMKASELLPWQRQAYDIFLAKPNKRHIYWFYGSKNTGKTEMARFLWFNHNVPFSHGGEVENIMNLAYNNMDSECNCFVFCLTRFKQNRISYDALERLKDGMISNNKYETGCKCLPVRPHVFVFANAPPVEDPDEELMSSDRFVVIKCSDCIE